MNYKNTPMKLDLQFFGAGVSISGTEVDIDTVNNKSYINVTINVSTSGNTYNNSGSAYVNATLTGQNNTYNTGNIGFNIGYNTSKQVYYGKIGPFDHNQDGTLNNVTMSVYCHLTNSTSTSNSGSVAMSTIARASTITANDANIGSATTITINKNSSAFYTTLQYKFASQTTYTNIIEKTTLTSYGWTVPTSFYSLIPNDKYGTCTIKAITYSYNGTTYTNIGEKTTTFIATANEETCKPTLTGLSIDDGNATTKALTGSTTSNPKLVKGKSQPKITFSSTARNSATLVSTTINNVSVTSPATLNTTSGSNWYTIRATDSRGYITSAMYIDNTQIGGDYLYTLIDYIPLTLSFNALRTSPTSNEINVSFTGNYFNSTFGVSANTLALSWKYREAGETTWLTGGNFTANTHYKISGNTFYSGNGTEEEQIILSSSLFNYEKSYDIQIVAVDKLTTYNTQQTVLRGIPVWYYKADEFGTTQTTNLKSNVALNGTYDEYDEHNIQLNGTAGLNGYNLLHSNLVKNNLTTTSSGYVLDARQGKTLNDKVVNLNEVVLYNNDTGTTGNITLSDSAANYRYIEVYTKSWVGYSSCKFYSPNGKSIIVSIVFGDGNGVYSYANTYAVNGTAMTVNTSRSGQSGVTGTNRCIYEDGVPATVVRVVGYK